MTDLIDRSSEEAAGVTPADDPPATVQADAPPRDIDLPVAVRSALAALLAAAGVIHLVMVPSHWGTSVAEGAGFLVAGWLQIGLAVALVLRPARWMLQLTVVTNLALVAVWIVSRTAGLPFGPHAGHAETVSIVDGTTVTFELTAVALALGLLLRGIGFVRADSRALSVGVPIAALLFTSIAVASPSAHDHAAASHGDHGAMGHAHGDDNGLSLLDNGHQHGQGEEELDDATQAELAVQLAGTSALVERYPTVADAEAAGYRRAGPFAPGVGAHYRLNGVTDSADADGDGLLAGDEVDRPMLIFDGTAPGSPLAGFMYYISGEESPEGFAGGNDHWHYHTHTCIVPRADGTIDVPFADAEDATEAICNDVGGEWIAATGNMVHVWTVPGYQSELGTFNEINPALACPDGTYYQVPLEDLGPGETSTCRTT